MVAIDSSESVKSDVVRLQQATKSSSISNLDFLRAIAVLFVLIDHTLNHLRHSGDEGQNWLSWMGRLGVLFFFVHTCCVLMMSLERHKGEGLFSAFYTRRAFRIYPLSILAVAVSLACPYRIPLTKYEILSNFALTQNLTFARDAFGSIWTLPLEVQMYFFLPFIFLLMHRFKGMWLPNSLFALSVPLAIWQPHHVARASVLAFAPCFLPGVMAYWIFRNRRAIIPAWCFPVILAIITAAFLYRPGWGISAWAACLCVGATIPFFRQLNSGALNKSSFTIAKYSYGIYLSHSLILMWMRLTWKAIPIYLLAVTACSVLTYHLVERPMIGIGQKIITMRNLSRPAPIVPIVR